MAAHNLFTCHGLPLNALYLFQVDVTFTKIYGENILPITFLNSFYDSKSICQSEASIPLLISYHKFNLQVFITYHIKFFCCWKYWDGSKLAKHSARQCSIKMISRLKRRNPCRFDFSFQLFLEVWFTERHLHISDCFRMHFWTNIGSEKKEKRKPEIRTNANIFFFYALCARLNFRSKTFLISIHISHEHIYISG